MVNYYLNKQVDVGQLCELRRSVGWNRMEASLRDPKLQRFLSISAYDDDSLIGHIEVVSNGVTDAYIQDLMVHPEWQHQGIGTQLMDMAILELKKRDIYMISVIYGEKELQGYYEKFGFSSMLCGQMQLRDED